MSKQNTLDNPFPRDSIGTRIKQILLERIVDGTYKPGHRIKELQIAREFHVSQAPVREALRELEATGLIETKYYQGSRVRSSTLRELEQAYEIRAVLEELAAPTAAKSLKARTENLKQIVDRATLLLKKGDWRPYTRYNYLFHHSIVVAAGNPLLLQVWESLHFEFRTRLFFVERSSSDIERLSNEHYKIINALHNGKGRKAGRLLREHCLANVMILRKSQSAALGHRSKAKSAKIEFSLEAPRS